MEDFLEPHVGPRLGLKSGRGRDRVRLLRETRRVYEETHRSLCVLAKRGIVLKGVNKRM